jgi:hypothetical protein
MRFLVLSLNTQNQNFDFAFSTKQLLRQNTSGGKKRGKLCSFVRSPAVPVLKMNGG